MATSITPRMKCPLGGGLVLEAGDYNTDGSTTLTLNFSGGYIITAQFADANQNPLDALSSPAVTLSARSTSGGVTSYTLTPASGAVTNGTYFCIHGGS
jgi:hypothetical protein